LRILFANLNIQQKEKLNELISAIHEKDELLDTQEDFLIKENKKHVKVKNAYALEVEKCEKLFSELSTCHDTIVVGAKAKTPPFARGLRCSRWSYRDKTGRDTLRLIGTKRRPAMTSSHSAASSSSEAHVRSGPS
jgi:hypothetical protein